MTIITTGNKKQPIIPQKKFQMLPLATMITLSIFAILIINQIIMFPPTQIVVINVIKLKSANQIYSKRVQFKNELINPLLILFPFHIY